MCINSSEGAESDSSLTLSYFNYLLIMKSKIQKVSFSHKYIEWIQSTSTITVDLGIKTDT